MNTLHHSQPIEFDLLSTAMQQHLQSQIARHNGEIAPVVDAVRAELAQLDNSPDAHMDATQRSYQARRALLVAQLDYLAKVGNVRHAQD